MDHVWQGWQDLNLRMRESTELMDHVWQGWQDLNLRMRESKSRALPLGDTPKLTGGHAVGVSSGT